MDILTFASGNKDRHRPHRFLDGRSVTRNEREDQFAKGSRYNGEFVGLACECDKVCSDWQHVLCLNKPHRKNKGLTLAARTGVKSFNMDLLPYLGASVRILL